MQYLLMTLNLPVSKCCMKGSTIGKCVTVLLVQLVSQLKNLEVDLCMWNRNTSFTYNNIFVPVLKAYSAEPSQSLSDEP